MIDVHISTPRFQIELTVVKPIWRSTVVAKPHRRRLLRDHKFQARPRALYVPPAQADSHDVHNKLSHVDVR